MIFFTILFYLFYWFFSRRIQKNEFQNAFLIFMLFWLIPLIIYQLTPFELAITVNYYIIYLFLSIFMFVLYSSFVNISKKKIVELKVKSPYIFIIFAYIGCILLYSDLYVLRGLSFVSPFDNRDKYSDYAVSGLTYLWLLFIPFVIFNIVLYSDNLNYFKKINIGIPIFLSSVFFLLSGNRQFVFFIALFFTYKLILKNEKLDIKRVIIKLFPAIVLLGILFFAIQILRQQGTQGSQLTYILTITGMNCKSEYFCDDSLLILLLAYIFNYFGNIYHGLTLFFENDITAPIGSLSAPLVYRRLSDIFDLQSHSGIIAGLDLKVEYLTGYFPAFWKTMFASFYAEGGIIFLIIILLLIYLSFVSLCVQSNKYISKNIVAFNLSFISFGLMFPPTAEPFLFMVYIYLFVYLKFFKNKYILVYQK